MAQIVSYVDSLGYLRCVACNGDRPGRACYADSCDPSDPCDRCGRTFHRMTRDSLSRVVAGMEAYVSAGGSVMLATLTINAAREALHAGQFPGQYTSYWAEVGDARTELDCYLPRTR